MSDIGKRLIEGMEDFNQRLQNAGGNIEATGLRHTTYKQCESCLGSGFEYERAGRNHFVKSAKCQICKGLGYIRTVNDGTGQQN